MIRKGIKNVAVVTLGVIAVGLFVFGTDVFSYVSTSARSVKTAVKDNVPIEFELQRARDMIEQILPELQANIRLIAQEEVEIATLEKEIAQAQEDLVDQQRGIAHLRNRLDSQQVSFEVGPANYSREQLTDRLAHRFERFKESETAMVGRERLLEARRRSLAAAEQMLDRARQQKGELEQKIEGLVAQHRLIQSSSVAVDLQVDGRRLNKADHLIKDIQKRLDVAQRVIARQSDFLDDQTDVSYVDEESLLAEIDQHFDDDDGVNVTVVAVKK
jgi:peptidoglycan hydrolase CwlO-like protein